MSSTPMQKTSSRLVMGIDLAILNTGLAVVQDGQLLYASAFSSLDIRTKDERKLARRAADWLDAFQGELAMIGTLTGGAKILVRYESRPFVFAMHRKKRQSPESILSYGEAVGLMRAGLAGWLDADKIEIEAIPPGQWQRAMTDGLLLPAHLLDEATARYGERERAKALSLAHAYFKTGIWPRNDHEADAINIAWRE